MFLLKKPSCSQLDDIIALNLSRGFNYHEVGATRLISEPETAQPFSNYRLLHHRTTLGSGSEVYARAREAFSRWGMFHLNWLVLHPPAAPMAEGTILVVLGRTMGTWWPNVSRIIYTFDETGPVHRLGFAYGTMPGNAASGEERMQVEWNRDNDRVEFELFSFSRVQALHVRPFAPYFRVLQNRFARESGLAMRRLTTG